MPTTFNNGESGSSVRQKLNETITAVNALQTNNTGTNTGDQDLSTYQVKLAEGEFTNGDKTKLDSIGVGAEANTIDSIITGEPDGSDQVLNVVSLTQAEYDAGTPVATTFYIITG